MLSLSIADGIGSSVEPSIPSPAQKEASEPVCTDTADEGFY